MKIQISSVDSELTSTIKLSLLRCYTKPSSSISLRQSQKTEVYCTLKICSNTNHLLHPLVCVNSALVAIMLDIFFLHEELLEVLWSSPVISWSWNTWWQTVRRAVVIGTARYETYVDLCHSFMITFNIDLSTRFINILQLEFRSHTICKRWEHDFAYKINDMHYSTDYIHYIFANQDGSASISPHCIRYQPFSKNFEQVLVCTLLRLPVNKVHDIHRCLDLS